MARIKIISDPYRQITKFESWNSVAEIWTTISMETCPNSRLLTDKLKKGFFPFKVRQIVDILIEEYGTDSDPVEIIFEGTDDEFRELESICNDSDYQEKIHASQSKRYLENARDILPDVIEVFKVLKPLVEESASKTEKLQKELDRFSDASNEAIPICVIGNYSSGKSTFINALVGYELLPSSDEPTTAKIYRIGQSEYEDTAYLRFGFAKKQVSIRLRADSFRFVTDPDDNPLSQKISAILEKLASEPIPRKLNAVLEAINGYANEESSETVSDLIEVDAPFGENGIWGRSRHNFVIFDTPGSNSASNRKHYTVLQKAMEDLTNGLPIFVSEYDSLDSTDNDKLYQDINNMEELDNRFTMIIVNKADIAALKKGGFTEADRTRILNLAIPRKLYSGGVYFLSSVMGLGSKNGGDFVNDHNAEIYDDQVSKYTNPSHRAYKTLYRYNILPAQIKKKYDELSEKQGNLMYANSGLYSVEQAIQTFASVYSHYNKCQQSELFLSKIIQITFQEIAEKKAQREEQRKNIKRILEAGKEKLLEQIEEESEIQQCAFVKEFTDRVTQLFDIAPDQCSQEELRQLEGSLRQDKSDEKNVEKKRDEMWSSAREIGGHLVGTVSQAFREKDLKLMKKVGSDIVTDAQKFTGERTVFLETLQNVSKESSDDMLAQVKERFAEKWVQARTDLEHNTRIYWEQHTEEFKKILLDLVTNSTALQETQREKLTGIIMEYHEMKYTLSTDEIFEKNKFLHRIFGDTERMRIDSLARQYNKYMKSEVQAVADNLKASENKSFISWCNDLVNLIRDNIVELNPDLYTHSRSIAEETERIGELEVRIQMLEDYSSQIRSMMAWKES